MNRRFLVGGLILLVSAGALIAQQNSSLDVASLGVDTAQQNLREISVDRFEDPGFWLSAIPSDRGLVIHRRLNGGPAGKEPIPGEVEAGIEVVDENVIGMKVDFYRRGEVQVSLVPVQPIAIPGIVKTLSMWVVGRNFRHRLSVVLEDHFGNAVVLPMGQLNFSGWNQLTVAVPPTIRQRSAHYHTETGLLVTGFVIDAEIEEAYGTYYVYFDDLRAVTDLFAEESRDPDDMVDNW